MKLANKVLKNNLVLAPMTKFSDHAFRISCLQHGAGLVITEKYHINGLYNNFSKYKNNLTFSLEEHPVALQLIGKDVKIFKKILDLLTSYEHDFLDLNMCCPSPEAFRDEMGGFLLGYPEKVRQIISIILKHSEVPVSAKIRSGWNQSSINAVRIAKLLEQEGVEFITVHGRTIEDQYETSKNNNFIIKKVKEAVQIPVIASGDIIDGKSAELTTQKTNCDLLMIGRAAIGNPFIFENILHYRSTRKETPITPIKYEEFLKEYIQLLKTREPDLVKHVNQLKDHLTRNLRFNFLKKINKSDISSLKSFEELELKLKV